MISKSIIRKNSFLIRKLIKSGRTDLDIISLILCESHFRKKNDRVIEYIILPILFFISKKRFKKLSVGIAQIQLKHWIKIKNIKSPISFKSYLTYFSIIENYDVLKELIYYNLEDNYNDSRLIAFHTGETRKYHLSLFQDIKNQLNII